MREEGSRRDLGARVIPHGTLAVYRFEPIQGRNSASVLRRGRGGWVTASGPTHPCGVRP